MADLKLTVDYSELVAAAKTTDQTKQTLRLLGQQFARTGDQSAYMRAVNQVANAQKKLAVESRMSRGEIMKLASQYRQTTVYADALAQAAQRSTRGLARSGVVMQQTGYQVGDFLVQVQSGTNAFVAFGQQATQLAGLLTMSMNPKLIALGATLSIVIPLFTAVAAGIMRTREASDSASGGFTTIKDAMQAAREESSRMADEIERLNRGLKDNAQLNVARAIEQQRLRVIEAEALAEQVAGTDGDAVARQRLAREQETLRQLEAQLQTLKDQAQQIDFINNNERDRQRRERETREQAERTAQFIAEQEELLANQTILYLEIAKYGENSLKVEEERAYQARLAYENELRRKEVDEALILVMMDQYDAMVKAREEAESSAKKAEEFADKLGISLDYAQQLAAIGFGNIWEGADGAAQLASNLALAARMAANYEGRENAFGGVRVGGEPPIMTSEGIEVRPQTLAPRLNPFAGMELEDLLPPREKSKGAEGPNAIERLQQEIAFRQRTLNLSKEEKALQTEIFRITNALGKDRNKYSSDFIANLAQQNLAIQEQERVIEEARQQQEQLADSIANSFGDAFMSIVDGTKSTKDAFKEMAAAIVRDLYQVYVMKRLIGSAEAGTGIAGAIGRLIGLESGGTMTANRPYIVGERGPELVIPGRSSTVTNADLTRKSMGGSDAVNVVNNINVTGGTDPAAIRMEVAKLMPAITNATKSAVIDARRRGGQMKAAFG
jgi:hypothetical protein